MIALGCDHGGYELMQEVKKHLEERGLEYRDFGCNGPESVDYPVYGKKVAQAVQSGECENGILICGTGIGISITANKFKGIRAALCTDCFTAEATRLQYSGYGGTRGRSWTCTEDCRYFPGYTVFQ